MMSSFQALTDTYLYRVARSVLIGEISLENATSQLTATAEWGKPSDGEINKVDVLIQDLIKTQQEPRFAYILAELNLAVCQAVGGPSQEAICANTVGEAITNLRDPRLTPRRIEMYERALEIVERIGDEWQAAVLCTNLGNAYSELPVGDHQTNLQTAIDYFERALPVFTPDTNPYAWAVIQNNLAATFRDKPGDDEENIQPVIDSWERALTVFSRANYPLEWANVHRNLGIAYKDLNSGNPVSNLTRARDHLLLALEVYTPEHQPVTWAEIENSLGNVYFNLTISNRSENLRKAVACFEAALEIRTRETFPVQFATTCVNLGNAWLSLPDGDRVANLRRAIEYYEQSLSIYTARDFPRMNAQIQANLAAAYLYLPAGDRAQNLRRAQHSLNIALSVFTRASDPTKYAWVKTTQGAVYQAGVKNNPEQVAQAVTSYHEALEFYTADMFPADYARIMNALGALYRMSTDGNPQENYFLAEKSYHAALTIYQPEVYPDDFATTQTNLGNCYLFWPASNRHETLPKAIAAFEKALPIHTRDAFPREYARLMDSLGVAYSLLAGQGKTYHAAAWRCFQEALETAKAVGLRGEVTRIAGNAGSLSWQQGDWSAASTNLAMAIGALEDIWEEHYSPTGKTMLQSEHDSLYSRMVQACYRLNRKIDAFNYMERGRNRYLLTLLGDTLVPPVVVPPETRTKLEQIAHLSDDLYAMSAVMEQTSTPDQILFFIQREELLRQERSRLLEELANELPEFVALRQGQPLDFAAIRKVLTT